MKVLKPDLQATIRALLNRGLSQGEIERKTGIDRKTIRRYAQLYHLVTFQEGEPSKSPMEQDVATGSVEPSVENLPPRPRHGLTVRHASGASHGMHPLRHTLAGVLLEQGTPLPVIAEILGHRSTLSTGV